MKTPGVNSHESQVREKNKLEELSGQAEVALALLDSETAEGIIGEHTDEYDALIQGASAVMAMEWAVMKTHGLRQTPRALRAGAQALMMVLTLVHYAYALGLRQGRSEGKKAPARRRKSKLTSQES